MADELNVKALEIAYELFKEEFGGPDAQAPGPEGDGTLSVAAAGAPKLSASQKAKRLGDIVARIISPIRDSEDFQTTRVLRSRLRSGTRKLGWNSRQEPDDDIPGCNEPGGGSGDCANGRD